MVIMHEIDYDECVDWIYALRYFTGKGYRKTHTGYETFVSDRCRSISLGTYRYLEDAKEAVFNYRVDRLVKSISSYSLDIDDSKVFMSKYLAFPEGLIFNIHGNLMRYSIDKNGYVHGLFNGRNLHYHRIIATLFCYRPQGCDYVNHLDGNKQNNSADNLEWCTRSENAKHAYRIGLQRSNGRGSLYSLDELQYIRNHCFDYYKDVAFHLNKNPETIKHYMYRYRKENTNA